MLEVQFDCDAIDPETISEYLMEIGCSSVSCEMKSERKKILDKEDWNDLIKVKNWETALLRANFPFSFDIDRLIFIVVTTFPDVKFDFKTTIVPEKDWVTHVQSMWDPITVGNLTIVLPWHKQDNSSNKKSPRTIILEGGAAFGTGDHPTTRLCLRWLEKCVKTSKDPVSVLDYGCGSAILAIAAMAFGAKAGYTIRFLCIGGLISFFSGSIRGGY
jgi:ribosomal protein L11 methyltransferase